MSASILDFFHSAFRIRPEEFKRTALAFFYLFTAIGAFIIGRIARTVLFLEIPNYKEQLPLMYIGIAIGVSITMLFYSKVERRLRRDQTNSITLVVLILITFLFRFALQNGGETIYWAFYIWVEIFGTFLIVQFWSFTNEIFHSRQAKRLFAIIGGGGVLSNVVIGFGIKNTVKSIGTENLLYVICGCLALSLITVLALGKNARADLTAAHEKKPTAKTRDGKPKGEKVFTTRHVQLIAMVVVITYIVSTIVDYQFQVIIGDSIPVKDERSAFFGSFFGITGILAGIIQFFFTARILERFGVLTALIMLPIGMLVGSAGILMVPFFAALSAVSFTKGAENCLRYTVNDATLQLLYLPVPGHLRGRAKAFIDGILKPLAIGGAGLLLALMVGKLDNTLGISLGMGFRVYSLSWVVALLLVGWLIALLALRKEYLKSLLDTLERRRLNLADASFEINNDETIQMLLKYLRSQKPGEVLHALELLKFVSSKHKQNVLPLVLNLLEHQANEVRCETLRFLGKFGDQISTEQVSPMLDDPSPLVRASAIMTYCALARAKATTHISKLLNDPSTKVRAAAVAGLIRFGGLDGVLASADMLKKMLASHSPREREYAAWILGEVGVQHFYQPLVPLLEDQHPKVRQAAILAAGLLQSQDLISHLIKQFESPRFAATAVNALAQYGEQAVDIAAGLLDDPNHGSAIRAQAPKILARIATDHCADVLCNHLLDEDIHVRSASVLGMVSLLRRNHHIHTDREAVGFAIHMEAKGYFELLNLQHNLELDAKTSLLSDALSHRQNQIVERLLGLLSLKYPSQTIEVVSNNLKSPNVSTRANALEVLDNLLNKDEKSYIIPLLDDSAGERKLQVGGEIFQLQDYNRQERLIELLEGRDTWLKVAAGMAVYHWDLHDLSPQVDKMLHHDEALCRETAIFVGRKLSLTHQHKDILLDLIHDPAHQVSTYARFALAKMAPSN
ncbi:MAG: Npt1/Npt2 family nucleotide transporter [Myxococcota bacterium]|jgi:HEAT repeat protein|nr:Npt1/Npt2 family nucleotide transporter [Myxococcota bacterium]